jgi:hypothetical protein
MNPGPSIVPQQYAMMQPGERLPARFELFGKR